MYQYIIAALALAVNVYAASSELQIIPGATLTANNYGRHMQAHGGGIIKVDDTFYLVGEDKTNGTFFHNINCFSSKNLVEWNYEGAILSQTGKDELGPNRIVERPKVIYNKSTKKYVLYLHIDGMFYNEAKVGIATSDTVCGKYEFHRSFRPFDHESRDMGLYQEDDGTAYLMSEDRPTGAHIYKLSDDYLDVTDTVYTWKKAVESPAMFKRNGNYYIFGSDLTGWTTNDNFYSTAPNLAGPWSEWKKFVPNGSKTYNSQTSFILPISNDLVIYMGDRWHEKNLMRSTYVWLPLEFSGTNDLDVFMRFHDHWIIDVEKGTWRKGQDEEQYSGQDANLSNGARVLGCANCKDQRSVGYIGGSSSGEALFSKVKANGAGKRMMRIFSPNGDFTERFAGVSINGQEPIRVAFLPTNDADTPDVAGVIVDFKDGDNTIKIQGTGEGWGPDVDRVMVPMFT
ncbi:Arabinanase/levansucrase/invertase [Tothia fuscella]|uniref:Arabinanase/levansucrase/invertase n=1 Tax=Tothia fuscella TaxID=1048955 RepID=A0A9P4P0M9_9PEZI|nr:Arabinanase/levansucrase/invertase [Tothia fuscella]